MNAQESSDKSQSNSVDEPQENLPELFPIVGIGASAGGLEAFTELLSHLPTDTGMGFVLIQHLSPHQKSMLSEILARTTQMPVTEVQDGMTVAPDHVYIIPPNSLMTISQGILQLHPRDETRVRMTIDTFFYSLATDRLNKAIGVVLSGADADGTRGLEAIKEAGGITFAQSEKSAQVSTMPNTAVASGHVDFILTPQQIAAEIANISLHPYLRQPTPTKPTDVIPESGDALSIIFRLLRTATGVDFTQYKQNTLNRRIFRRMILYKLEKLEDYAEYLQNNPAEVIALYQDVLITVTNFFRDPEAFEALKTSVFPIITQERQGDSPIRVWIAGCSTGEEAYSIAICLLEFLRVRGIHVPIQIFATDVNEVVIDKARIGIYKPSEIADVSGERLANFFVKVEGGYQISKSVREVCVFARHNLMSDPPFSRLDLITCRNVLIYLGASVQKKLLPIFHYALKPTGFLMLGNSETVGEFYNLFDTVDKKYKIYSRKISSERLGIELIPSNYTPEAFNAIATTREDTWNDQEIQKEADRIVLSQYAPVGVIINNELEIVQFRGQTSSYLQPAPGRPSFNLLKMAKEDLRLELRTAIHQSKKQNIPITKEGIKTRKDEQVKEVRIDVIPFQSVAETENYFLILFQDTIKQVISDSPDRTTTRNRSNIKTQQGKQASLELENSRLKHELATTKEYLQSIIEEQQSTNQDLRAANEEILSSNEELQSTNEELETAKEEIQATNEELNTINDELQRRNLESIQISNDLQNLLSSINIPILMLGGDLRIRRFTPVAEKLFNLISTDVGRRFGDINHKLNISDLEEQIFEVIRTLNYKTQEVQDDQGHWYDLRIRPYRTIDNKIDGAVVILVDIDALKHSALQLKTSRDYVQAIVDTMRESLVVLDRDLQVISANQFFYDTFEVEKEQTEQRRIYEIGNGQWNIPQLRSLLEDILPHQTQFQGMEVEHNFENIGQKIMRVNARKMTIEDDRQMILLVIEDITQQKQLEAERTQLLAQEQLARNAAEAANRAKDEFLSILSHELRNPLNSLLGWAQLLQKQEVDHATINQGLEAIKRSAEAQARLINDLLDTSRISSGRLRLDAETVELAPIIQAATDVVRLSAEAKNIEIVSTLNTSPRSIIADPTRLQQILWNLLSNAIKFTPSGGRIDVRLDYVGNQAQIQVSDTGIGITAEFLPFIFDRFRQADGSRTRTNTGLGLGLAIVRHLVELHGGTIEAQSAGVDQGATFTIILPLRTEQQQRAVPILQESTVTTDEPESPTDDIPSLAGVRVLVVDDQADICQLFKIILEDGGAQVTQAASAREALSLMNSHPGGYDVLLTDIGLPREDGYALIRQVRELSPQVGGQIPAAALTAYAGDVEKQKALAAGFQMHFAKPIEPLQLLSVVATLAGRISGTDI